MNIILLYNLRLIKNANYINKKNYTKPGIKITFPAFKED